MKYPYHCDGMLTIECQSATEQKLSKEQASQLTNLVGKDLHAVLGIQDQTALVFCGAAFPTEQLLQPKFPIQKHITQYASAAFQGELNTDQVLSIGANDGLMPDGLEPQPSTQNLLHLPFCLYTSDLRMAEKFEASLMHKGMVSPPTYGCLNELFNPNGSNSINHANYMTYLDLTAMMHNHYEQLGLAHLWQIIETALVNQAPKTAVQTASNNHFFLVDHLLFTPCFSWSQFSRYFQTNDIQEYINWLMAQRLSLGAFAVHGLQIKPFRANQWPINEDKVCLGEFEKQLITSSYWIDLVESTEKHPEHVVYHQHDNAGVVAISASNSSGAGCLVYYPITPHGIADIEHHLQQQFGTEMKTTTQALADNPNWLL